MQSKATTVTQYLKELPEDRRKAIKQVRKAIKDNLPKGFKETMQYGMISYVVPHSIYPAGYHCNPKDALPFASLASQKNHMAVYLSSIYGDPKLKSWFEKEYKKTGKKMDIGKSCVRFKKIEDLPVELVGKAVSKMSVDEYIQMYEKNRGKRRKKK